MRNRCLAVLSARRSLPVPSSDDLADIGDSVGLDAAWSRWEEAHRSSPKVSRAAPRPTTRTRPGWRSSLAMKAAVVLTGLLGFAVGERWLPRADAQASAGSIEPRWEAVTESAISTANASLLAANASGVRPRLELSPSAVAALILGARRRALASMSNVEASSDSLLWIQGRLSGSARFEIGGDLRVVRRGLAELRVNHFVLDGRNVAPTSISQILAGDEPTVVGTNRLRFNVPWFIAGMIPTDGAIEVIAEPTARGAGGRVSP